MKIVDIEFTEVDGKVQWRPVFSDKSVGLYANTDVRMDGPQDEFKRFSKELRGGLIGQEVID